MNDKVEIIIEEGHHYSFKEKLGIEFTSVGYDGRNYGGASPCDNPEEIRRAIEHAKKRITEEGDRPIIIDKRKKSLLTNWIKN